MKLSDVDYLRVRMISIQELKIRITLEDGGALEFDYPTEAKLSRDFEASTKGDRVKVRTSENG